MAANNTSGFSTILKILAHVEHSPHAKLTESKADSKRGSQCLICLTLTIISTLNLHRQQSNRPRDTFSTKSEVMETGFLQLMQGIYKMN